MSADDLDGNWAPSSDVAVAGVTEEAADATIVKSGKGKKRKLSSKDVPTEVSEKPSSAAAKRRRKKAKRKQGEAQGAAAPTAGADADELSTWAAGKLTATWAVEVKASSLSSIEAKEFRPAASWFLPLVPSENLRRLPGKLPAGWDAKLNPKCVSVIILCTSAERVFGILEELKKALKFKPLVLATHGGGRKADQLKRQASALAKGAHLAIATPGRLLRLLDEGHLQASSLKCIAVDLCQDRKKRDVLSQPETRRDVLGLMRKHLVQLLNGGGLKLSFCGAP